MERVASPTAVPVALVRVEVALPTAPETFVAVEVALPTALVAVEVAVATAPLLVVAVDVVPPAAPVAFVTVEEAPETVPAVFAAAEVAVDTGAGGGAAAFTAGAFTGKEAAGTGGVAAGTLGADGVETGVAGRLAPAPPAGGGVVLGSGRVASAFPAATRTSPKTASVSARNFAAEIRTSSECIPDPAGFNPVGSMFSRS